MNDSATHINTTLDPSVIEERRERVTETVDRIRVLEERHGLNRACLQLIARELVALTEHKTLFSHQHFPNPKQGEPAKLYLLSEDDNGRFPLYLTCARPGGSVRPHNHGTWAVVAGLEGCEENMFYERVEGGLNPGPAQIKHDSTERVHDGEFVVMMPDDTHSVATPGEISRRHFHMYGLSLEQLPKRLAYDMNNDTCSYMEINPKIVRVAHA